MPQVMASVRNIANHQRTVISTIHSPSESVFNLFDTLILLSMGRQTYFGSTKSVIEYFAKPHLGFTYKLGVNPADFCMQASEGLLRCVGP
jgi:ABC-type multidrug transport system ATPase subunit